MKGTIVKCMEEMVTSRIGPDQWKDVLGRAGLPKWRNFLNFEDVAECEVINIMNGIEQVTGLCKDDVINAFGEYWSTIYAPRIYKSYFEKAKNAKGFLLQLDSVHEEMTRAMQSARPPHFTDWYSARHLVMFYQSDRGLAALMAGLVRGVGKYYKENLTVNVSGNSGHVLFP